MLILTRRVWEKIKIGDDIEVVVTEIQGSQVQLGITAPKEIPVYLQEIYERIRKEKEGSNATRR